MSAPMLNRFEWLKAILQLKELNASTKNVASALAVKFANDETGQINPSNTTLAAFLDTSVDTIKRGIRALESAGWISRTEGRGRGNYTRYTLLSPGQVVAISSQKKEVDMHLKKGCNAAPSSQEKRATLHGKEGSAAPSRIEQTSEQYLAPIERFRHYRFIGNAFDGLTLIASTNYDDLYKWAQWVKAEGYPTLRSLPITKQKTNGDGELFCLPSRQPPTDEKGNEEARWFFDAITERQEAACAAQ